MACFVAQDGAVVDDAALPTHQLKHVRPGSREQAQLLRAPSS